MNTDDSFFGPAIHTYSRAQAIADGALVDLTVKAREHGVTMPFKFPVAATAAVWAWIVPSPGDDAEPVITLMLPDED